MANIALVEDNPIDSQIINAKFVSSTHKMHSAADLDSLSTEIGWMDIELLLLDLNLPNSKGIETLKAVKVSFPYIPIVVIIGISTAEISSELIACGAREVVCKLDLDKLDLEKLISDILVNESKSQ